MTAPTPLRVLYAGTPETAVPVLHALLDSPHEVVGVLTRPDAPVGRRRVLTPSPVAIVAEEAGVAAPSGCRMGICHACLTPLRSGQVTDLRSGEVHGEPGELIQTCVSAAAGPLSLDL